MFRTGTVLYLIATLLASPFLCCCQASRFVPRPSDAPAPKPKTTAPRSCCHAPEAEEADTNRSHPSAPACPCKNGPRCEVLALPVLAPAPEGDPLVSSDFAQPPAVPARVLRLASGGLAGPAPPLRQLPFVTRDDLLRVQHMLRC